MSDGDCTSTLVQTPPLRHLISCLGSGESGEEIIARLKRDLVPTLVSGIMYWPMCDFITFKFIPIHLQVQEFAPLLHLYGYICFSPCTLLLFLSFNLALTNFSFLHNMVETLLNNTYQLSKTVWWGFLSLAWPCGCSLAVDFTLTVT